MIYPRGNLPEDVENSKIFPKISYGFQLSGPFYAARQAAKANLAATSREQKLLMTKGTGQEVLQSMKTHLSLGSKWIKTRMNHLFSDGIWGFP